MPPSSNGAYRPFVSKGKMRFASTADWASFKRDFTVYRLLNAAAFKVAEGVIAKVTPLTLGIHCDFYFPHEKLFTKDGRLKKLDVSNRLKALHDCVAEALGVDDCVFTEISATKAVGKLGVTVEVYAT